MDSSLRDLESDVDNQGLSSIDTNMSEHKFTGDGEELAAENMEPWLDEASNKVNLHVPTPNLKFTSRKVHSAAPITNGFGHSDSFEDIPRPYTAAEPSSSTMARSRKKKSAAVRKKTTEDSKTPRKERPRSADLNGWGDFDTDRLLRDDLEDQSNQTTLDRQDGQRTKSRKSRRSTPATISPRTNPWEGYLTLNNEMKESSRPLVQMQVLRQKSIEILNLDVVAQENQSFGRSVTTPKPLLGRVSMERLLSSRSRPVTSHASRSGTPTSLFGTDILDTPENRAVIFRRFTDLWSLIAQSSESPSDAVVRPPLDAYTRSPFECSMTMVKICKAVGISLTPSVATRMSFWTTSEHGVEFESFCDLVIQGAIQPTLHHFNLDNSIAEYVSALDTILQSLVTTGSTRYDKDERALPNYDRRVKKLDEIQPLFVSWKAGISPRLVQPTETPVATPSKALVTAEKVRKALEASVSQHMLANQLPSEEARVTHVENIRRKVQLHKSWKPAEGKTVTRRSSSLMTKVSRSSIDPSHEGRISTSQAADLAEMLDRSRSVFPTTAGTASDDTFLCNEDHLVESPHFEANDVAPEKNENEEVLICCSCSVREAVLWCSSCFSVNCQKCWQEIHLCSVDMSMVSSESTSGKPLVGPTAMAMTKKPSGNVTLVPPVPMIYLPTKAMVSGTLTKGNPITRNCNTRRNSSNQIVSSATKDSVPAVVANAILPSLHKSRSDTTVLRYHERLHTENISASTTDSATELVKSLMLRMSPSTTATPDNRDPAMRQFKHHASVRPKLHLAPVSLDAEFLLSNTPKRRR